MDKMLIIDDTRLDCEILHNIFKDLFDVTISNDPQAYVTRVNNKEFDIVLLDNIMPKMTGLEFLELINVEKDINFPPIIVCSEDNRIESQIQAFNLGAYDYILKPYNTPNIVFKINKAVSLYKIINKRAKYEKQYREILDLMVSKANYNLTIKKVVEKIANMFNSSKGSYYKLENGYWTLAYKWSKDEYKDINVTFKDGYDLNKFPVIFFNFSKSFFFDDNSTYILNLSDITVRDRFEDLYSIGLASILCLPIFVNNKMYGIITCDNPDTTINITNDLLYSLSNSIGTFIERKQYQINMEYDELTGFYKYSKYLNELKGILPNINDNTYALIKVDISNFKIINTYFGFEEGNRILTELANMIKSYPNAVLAKSRIEGDEFSFVCKFDEEQFSLFIKDSNHKINKKVKGKNIFLHYGIYILNDLKEAPWLMYYKASLALKKNKTTQDSYTIYKTESLDKLVREQLIINHFENDLKLGKIVPFIQPKFDLKTKKYCGGEVLTRWYKDDGSLLSPQEFIPILEKTGLIKILDIFIFNKTLEILKNLIDKGVKVYPLSFNLSRGEIVKSNLARYIINRLAAMNIPHNLIELEITETVYIENEDIINNFCKEMINNGIKILIDDFGSGYSSLNTLKNLEYSIIKLDYKFLTKSKSIEKRNTIIYSIVQMARALNVPIIIEGVETKEDVEFFENQKVRYIQGYFFGKPMPINEFVNLIIEQEK